jgi:hypothetical protein
LFDFRLLQQYRHLTDVHKIRINVRFQCNRGHDNALDIPIAAGRLSLPCDGAATFFDGLLAPAGEPSAAGLIRRADIVNIQIDG